MKLKDASPWKKSNDKPGQHIKKQRHYFAIKSPSSLSYSFSSGHVWCESCTVKKVERWRIDFWTVVLEKTLESPLDCKEIQPVHSEGNQPWIFIGRTDAEAKAPILWCEEPTPWKRPWCWRQEEKGMTEDEMVEWRHWLNGHEFEQALGDGEGQGRLACCSPWGHKESDTI